MRVSVIIANRDQGQWLRQCVDSVATQTLSRGHSLEIIVVDGVSVDDSWVRVCTTYPGVDFIWLSEPDSGPNEAWNKGLRAATGEIVSFLPASDMLFQSVVVQYAIEGFYLDQGKVAFQGGWVQVIDEDGHLIPETWCQGLRSLCPCTCTDYPMYFLDLDIYPPLQGAFFRRDLALAIGGMSEKYQSCHTLFFLKYFLTASRRGLSVGMMPGFSGYFRRHSNARSDREGIRGIPYAQERIAFCKEMAREFPDVLNRQHLHQLLANAYKREWISRRVYSKQPVWKWIGAYVRYTHHRALSR